MRKTFSILEITLYVLIVSVVGVYVTFIVSRYFEYLDINKTTLIFSEKYDGIIKNLYSKNKDGWMLYKPVGTGLLLMMNSGNYQGISCLESGLFFTNISPLVADIVWTGEYDQVYTGFECQDLTGVSITSGYWINISTNFFGRNLSQKYYFQKYEGNSAGINGECGTANKTYTYDVTSYGTDSFCALGTASPLTPVFPAQGSSTTWDCVGLSGGNNVSCTGTRNTP